MSTKLKRIIAAVIFLLFSAALVIFALEKVSKGKIDGFSSKATALIKAKYGIDTEISGLDVSFFPPRIFVKKAVLSLNGSELAALEKCSLGNLQKMLFSDEKKLKINCANSRIHADKALKAPLLPDKEKDKEKEKNENRRNAAMVSVT